MQAREELELRSSAPRLLRMHVQANPREGDKRFNGEVRLCHRCGRRTRFQIDPRGVWYQCLRCGHYD
jgi:hypothetical protein